MDIKNRVVWIDYLKIIACLMVLIGHYYNAFYSFCNYSPSLNSNIVFFFKNFPSPYLDGNFWVCVFCVLSGYLASRKEISSVKTMIKEFVLRYFRFIIPLTIINVCIYFIYLIIGFKSTEFSIIYSNNWLSSFFTNINLIDVVTNSIFLGSKLNGPLWMLKPLFIGNLIIIFLNYIKYILKKHNYSFYLVLLIVMFGLLAISLYKSQIYIYTFITVLGCILFNSKRVNIKFNFFVFLALLVIISFFANSHFVIRFTTINNISLINALLSLLFVFSLFHYKDMDKLKKTKNELGSISFYVYLVHWPIICSLSCYLILHFNNYTLGYITVLIITLFVVLTISYILSKTLDKYINSINNKIKSIINKVLKI